MKVRIKFSKRGVLKYIGHLDLMRYFQKAFRRTDIEVLYSKGFSPHMIMSFAQPLGVGVESDGEYFDIETADTENISTIPARLNETMAEGIIVLDAVALPEKAENAMASVAAASYELYFLKGSPITSDVLNAFKEAEAVNYIKKTKTGEHSINVKDFVFEISLMENNDLFITVDCSSSGNLKPAVLLSAMFANTDIDISEYPYHVLRKETFKRLKDGKLVPLNYFDND